MRVKIVFCSSCRSPIHPESKFCRHCGHPVTEIKPRLGGVCCGVDYELSGEGTVYCVRCGGKLSLVQLHGNFASDRVGIESEPLSA